MQNIFTFYSNGHITLSNTKLTEVAMEAIFKLLWKIWIFPLHF